MKGRKVQDEKGCWLLKSAGGCLNYSTLLYLYRNCVVHSISLRLISLGLEPISCFGYC